MIRPSFAFYISMPGAAGNISDVEIILKTHTQSGKMCKSLVLPLDKRINRGGQDDRNGL